MKLAIFSAVATTLCLSGCASIAKNNCTTERVSSFAATDFEKNKYGSSLAQYEGLCTSNGYTLDVAAYQAAWKQEQSLYCTAEHALRLGEVGKDYGFEYGGQCTNFNAEAFEANLSRGERLRPYTLEVAKWRALLGDKRSPLEQAATDIQVTEEQFNDLGIGPNEALAIVVTDIVLDVLLRGRWERKLEEANAAKFEFVRSGYGEGPAALADFHAQRIADYNRNAVVYKQYMSAAAVSAKLIGWAEQYLGEGEPQEMTVAEFRVPAFVFTGRWPTELGIEAPTTVAAYGETSREGKFLKAVGLKDMVGTEEDVGAARAENKTRIDTYRTGAPGALIETPPAPEALPAVLAEATPAAQPDPGAMVAPGPERSTAKIAQAAPPPERTAVAVPPPPAAKTSSYASDMINSIRNRGKE